MARTTDIPQSAGAMLAGERLFAEAHEIACVRRSGVYAATVFGEDARIIASMQGLSRSLGQPVLEGFPT